MHVPRLDRGAVAGMREEFGGGDGAVDADGAFFEPSCSVAVCCNGMEV